MADNNRFDIDNFPTSPSALRMLSYVTEGFYDKAYVGKWLYQIMGMEYDTARTIMEELPYQMFPETATWGLMFHEIKWGLPVRENMPYEERRQRIYEKRDYRAPMTPYRMEQFLQNVIGMKVYVADIHNPTQYGYVPDHPNRFKVFFVGDETLDTKAAYSMINRLKQSHTTYKVNDRREIVIDESDIETLDLVNIGFEIELPFWGAFLHNGSFLHDGTVLHTTGRRYNLVLGMRENIGNLFHTEDLNFNKMFISSKTYNEQDITQAIRYHAILDFWGTYYHNGDIQHSGLYRHVGQRSGLIMALKIRAESSQEEHIGEATVLTRTRDCYFHDGSYMHNNIARHKTKYKKEVEL